jgi:signal transduction histidine kinase
MTTSRPHEAYADRVHVLYAWPRRHPKLLDAVLALGLASLDAVLHGRGRPAWLLAVILGIFVVVPVAFRRWHPIGAFIAAAAAGALQVALDAGPVGSDVSMLVLLYTLAAYRPRRTSTVGLAVCLAGAALAIARWAPARLLGTPALAGETLLFFTVPIVLAWVLGDSMRYRRGYYRALEERAARLERERDAQAQIAAAAERARIAREMHDVIAHNVSVMVVQADGAAFALDAEPERARQALAAISRTGRQALAEIRQMLGILRTGDDQAELSPQPGIDQLEDLLKQVRATGLPVSFTVEGVPRALPRGADLAAYRVIQESLTNTRKHGGPSASASVTLRYCQDGLMMCVADDGRGAAAVPGSDGHGLVGMRERVEMYGGTVRAGPRPGGGYQVTATLPFTAPAGGGRSSGTPAGAAASPGPGLAGMPPQGLARRGAA